MPRRLTTEEWITRARAVHGDKYDYSQVVYVNTDTPVTIICPRHGPFSQPPKEHSIHGCGCRQCAREDNGRHQFERAARKWVERARAAHGSRYDYAKVVYQGATTEVIIICPVHGEFRQTPASHLQGRHGCPDCGGKMRLTTEKWVARARAVHGDRFDYSRTVYVNGHTELTIVCPRHGSFTQLPGDHLKTQGCPSCSTSIGEKALCAALDACGIEYRTQWTDPTCRDQRALPFDVFIPELRELAEFDGEQHFRPVWWSRNISDEEAFSQFEYVRRHDRIKNEWARENGYCLIRIKDADQAWMVAESHLASVEYAQESICDV